MAGKDLKEIRFYQYLINSIENPAFIIFDVTGKHYLVNNSLIKILKFKDLSAFRNSVKNIFSLFDQKSSEKLDSLLRSDVQRRKLSLKIKSYNPEIANASFDFQRFNDSIRSIFSFIWKYDSQSSFLSRSVIEFFQRVEFLDEVMIILDFNGRLIASNREIHIIDFFADLTEKDINFFHLIDESYRSKFLNRLELLKRGKELPPIEYKLSRPNKTAYIEIYSKQIVYERKKAILALVRDITMRKAVEKNLLYAIVQTEERERLRYAQNLHDELGPFLSGLRLYFHELNRHNMAKEKRGELVKYLEKMLDEAIEKVRCFSTNMAPQNILEVGLSESVNNLIFKLNKTGKINIKFTSLGNENSFEKSLVISVYRIILELINNGIKHSGAKNLSVLLKFEETSLIKLIYEDNGKGFDLAKELIKNKGIGLKSIVNRVSFYNGKYKFERISPAGIRIDIGFPNER